jgi:hypothetical protein
MEVRGQVECQDVLMQSYLGDPTLPSSIDAILSIEFMRSNVLVDTAPCVQLSDTKHNCSVDSVADAPLPLLLGTRTISSLALES